MQEEFQKARPHLANRDFYVTGESYAVSLILPICILKCFVRAVSSFTALGEDGPIGMLAQQACQKDQAHTLATRCACFCRNALRRSDARHALALTRLCGSLHAQGHYVPAVAAHIYRTNQKKHESERISLKGIAIGNGLTDPGTKLPALQKCSENTVSSPLFTRAISWVSFSDCGGPAVTRGFGRLLQHRWFQKHVFHTSGCQPRPKLSTLVLMCRESVWLVRAFH